MSAVPGLKVTEASLVTVTGTQTPSGTTVVEGKRFTGLIRPAAGANVTYRNCLFEMPAVTSGDPSQCITSWGAGTRVTLEDCEVRIAAGAASYRTSSGIHGSGVTLLRTKVNGFVDPLVMAGIGQRAGWVVEDCELTTGTHYASDGGIHADGTHDDSIEMAGNCSTVVVRRTVIGSAYSSSVLVTQDLAGGYDSILFEDNQFPIDTGKAYGPLFNVKLEDPTLTNLTVRRNLFSTIQATSVARVVMDQAQLDAAAITSTGADANGWLNDGTPPNTVVPVYRGPGVTPSNFYGPY